MSEGFWRVMWEGFKACSPMARLEMRLEIERHRFYDAVIRPMFAPQRRRLQDWAARSDFGVFLEPDGSIVMLLPTGRAVS